ncbi:unnamed protein product [Rotaria sp. Silwood2]|nr:unnamed protein product [Rotaria sp. Silwood2]CAF3961785.1 unnamed protein product [Rotaria sp. Silwood2]
MEDNFEQLIATLQTSSSYNDVLCEIRHALEKQNSELLSSFISQFYQSILILEHWAWELFSQTSQQWIEEPKYLELFHTLALFNRNLIFNHDDIDANTKGSLLIPETVDCINVIFEKIEKTKDENDPFISIVSLWYDNLAEFFYANPEFEVSTIINHINHYMARHYVMTDQYKFYLNQLHQSPLSQSIFTTKQLFYIKTCSLSLSLYLFSKGQDFIYTPEELLHHFGADYVQILILHIYTIESWSSQLLSCIAHLMAFFASCCWWRGEKGPLGKIVFRTESSACEFIDALIHIIDHKTFYESITIPRLNDQTVLFDITLFSLIIVAQNGGFLWFLRSKASLPDTLLTIAKVSTCDKIRLCTYAILGEIICEEKLKELKISDSASSFFFNMLQQAWQHPSKKFKQIPIFFLFKCKSFVIVCGISLVNTFLGLVGFSKIDAFQQQIADTKKVFFLIEICNEYPIIYDILWALSFNHDIQEQLRSSASFITKIAHLPKEYDNQIRKSAHGILWNLEINHENHITSAISDERNFEIMISYSHKDEIICKQIYKELGNIGYRVWIDFDHMHGNMMDAMAQAIEQSNTILICMSEQYRGSSYCRAEATYAFQRRIRIIPILLQQHYKPDGWLLFLLGQLLYINFTKYEFSQAMEMLIKELKISGISEKDSINVYQNEGVNAIIPTTPISPEPSSMSMLPKNILDWDQTQVDDWLTSHGLLQMSRLFANFNGKSLMHMSEIIENVEPQQVISLLQDDSLRQTSQNLSLVELSRFRSLLEQQQHLTSSIIAKPAKVKTGKLKRKSSFCCQIT